jgi:hypothetical protein
VVVSRVEVIQDYGGNIGDTNKTMAVALWEDQQGKDSDVDIKGRNNQGRLGW